MTERDKVRLNQRRKTKKTTKNAARDPKLTPETDSLVLGFLSGHHCQQITLRKQGTHLSLGIKPVQKYLGTHKGFHCSLQRCTIINVHEMSAVRQEKGLQVF